MRKAPQNQLDESCDQVGTTNCYQQNQRRTLDEIAPVRYGFMPDKGTGNAIFVYGGSWKD